MNAAAKRAICAILSNVSAGRVLALSTHGIEEADAFCDRAGIMSRRVLALDRVERLCDKYGDALYMHVVHRDAPNTELAEIQRVRECVAQNLRFSVVQGSGVEMGQLFRLLESEKQNLGIGSYSVSPATLDQVFLKVEARQKQTHTLERAQIPPFTPSDELNHVPEDLSSMDKKTAENMPRSQQSTVPEPGAGQGKGGSQRWAIILFLTPQGTENVTSQESRISPASLARSAQGKIPTELPAARPATNHTANNTVTAENTAASVSLPAIFESQTNAMLALDHAAHNASKQSHLAYINGIVWATEDEKTAAKHELAKRFDACGKLLKQLNKNYLNRMHGKDDDGFTGSRISDAFATLVDIREGSHQGKVLDDEKASFVDTAAVAVYIYEKDKLEKERGSGVDTIEDELEEEKSRLRDLKRQHEKELAEAKARVAEVEKKRER
ncbi:MAG: hypothetical protein M1831_002912 [Alyxoria varia]|nr:MAG: hypothetical protein M1831_002912 [Alyxoria varia]